MSKATLVPEGEINNTLPQGSVSRYRKVCIKLLASALALTLAALRVANADPLGTLFEISSSPISDNLFPPATASSIISVKSINGWSGVVNLTAWCCPNGGPTRDEIAGTANLHDQSVTVPANGRVDTLLTITTSGAPIYGGFMVIINATIPGVDCPWCLAPPINFKVLPRDQDQHLPSCEDFTAQAPPPDVVPMQVPLSVAIDADHTIGKELEIGVFPLTPAFNYNANVFSWGVLTSRHGEVDSDKSLIVLDNPTNTVKQIRAYNGSSCSTVDKLFAWPRGNVQMKISRNETTALAIKPYGCAKDILGNCTTNNEVWIWVAGEVAFWPVFGGRIMTFRFPYNN